MENAIFLIRSDPIKIFLQIQSTENLYLFSLPLYQSSCSSSSSSWFSTCGSSASVFIPLQELELLAINESPTGIQEFGFLKIFLSPAHLQQSNDMSHTSLGKLKLENRAEILVVTVRYPTATISKLYQVSCK